jgi:hypothetical protein
MLAGDDPVLDTTNHEYHLEMECEAEEKILQRMAKLYNCLGMRQDSENLYGTWKECHCQNTKLTAVRFISNTEEISNASCSNFPYDSAAAIKVSKGSPEPPPLSAKYFSGEQTEAFNVWQINTID